jgi:hypothetical protein
MTQRGGRERSWLTLPIFPVAMTLAWILEVFVASGDPLPHLWRPLLIAVLGATLVAIASWALARGRLWPALVAGALLMLFLKAWLLLGLLAVAAIWRGLVTLRRRARQAAPLRTPAEVQITQMANVFGLVLLGVTLSTLLLSGVVALPPPRGAIARNAGGDQPNIYLLLLDGYPRADSLAGLGIDNSAFLRELEERDFAVAAGSRSNYVKTLLTLSSMLNGRYIENAPTGSGIGDQLPGQQRQMARAIGSASLLDDLRGRGFTIVNSPSAFGSAALFTADLLLEDGTMTQFEERVIRQSFVRESLALVDPDFIPNQLRADVLSPIQHAESLAERPPATPFFLLGHVFSPHPPFLFGANGEELPLPWCYELGCSLWTTEFEYMGVTRSDYARLMGGQIEFLNGRLLAMVDRITVADPEAVIILFSDHGARFDSQVTDEYYRTFFAARTPGQDGLFPDDVSPVNVLPLLENAYFGASLPIHDYQAWESGRLDLDLVPRKPEPR